MNKILLILLTTVALNANSKVISEKLGDGITKSCIEGYVYYIFIGAYKGGIVQAFKTPNHAGTPPIPIKCKEKQE